MTFWLKRVIALSFSIFFWSELIQSASLHLAKRIFFTKNMFNVFDNFGRCLRVDILRFYNLNVGDSVPK